VRKHDHGPPRAAGHSTGRPSITSTYPATGTGGTEIQKFGVKDRRWVVGLVFPQKCLLKGNEKDRRSSFWIAFCSGVSFLRPTDDVFGNCRSVREKRKDRRSGSPVRRCVHGMRSQLHQGV